MVRVLLVGEDADTRRLLRNGFELHGFTVLEAESGDRGLRVATFSRPGLIVLAGDSPGFDGADILERIRSWSDVPIIVLSSVSDESEKVRLLRMGADDYVVKPFSPSELVARLRAVMRRAQPGGAQNVLQFADVEVDTAAHRVSRSGRPIHLGPTEFRLLRYLITHPGRVFSREQLLDAVWGHDVYVEARTVDVHIRRLRKALNADDAVDVVRTVRSAGYALDHPMK